MLLILVLFVLIGCSPPTLHDTFVQGKTYEPAVTFISVMPIMVGKSMMMIPYVIHDDEDFVLTVIGYTEDGDRKGRRLYVDKETFDSTNIKDNVDHLTMQYKDEHDKKRQ